MPYELSLFDAYREIAESPWFDAAYYLQTYPEVARQGLDPVAHYLDHGARRGFGTSARFDTAYYLEQCAARGERPDNPLLHFIQRGSALGLRPAREEPPPAQATRSAHDDGGANLRLARLVWRPDGRFDLAANAAPPWPLHGFEVCIDGRPLDAARYRITASDVSSQSTLVACGTVAVDAETWHLVEVRLISGGDIRAVEAFELEVDTAREPTAVSLITRAAPARPIRMSLSLDLPPLAPGAARALVDKDLSVSGWAIGLARIDTVEILVDDQALMRVVPGIAREDVRATYPHYRHALRCGFHAFVPLQTLPAGEHEFTARAIDACGRTDRLSVPLTVRHDRAAPDQSELHVLLRETRQKLAGCVRAIDAEATRIEKVGRRGAQNRRPLTRIRQHLAALDQAVGHLDALQVPNAAQALQSIESVVRALGSTPQASPATAIARFAPLRLPDAGVPQVSIVIPAHNHFFFTYRCLESICRYRPKLPFEVILVDDASCDETRAAARLVENLTVLRNRSNRGFVASANRGATAARGDFLMLLNSDTRLTADAVDALVQSFSDPRVGMAGSKLVYPDGRLQEAGGLVWRDGSGCNYGQGGDPDHSDFNYLRTVDYCSGAALMIRRVLWEQLRGFDTAYSPGYYEDTDLAFRVRETGHRVVYQPRSVVIHHEGVSAGREVDRGMKAHQPINRRRFRRRWAESLKAHPPRGKDLLLARDHGARRRALFLDAVTPTPDQDAGSNVAVEHMRLLRDLGYKVSFVPVESLSYDARYTPALQQLGIEAIYPPCHRSLDDFLQARGHEFELAYVHRYTVGEIAIPLIRRYAPNAQVLFNNADLHYLRMSREAALLGSHAMQIHADQVRTSELAVIAAADATLLCNTHEMELIRRELPHAKLHYLPWVIEVPRQRPAPFSQRSGFMFLGGFGHRPNVDAVSRFVADIMPRLRRLLPGVAFHIYGSKMPDEVRGLAAADVIIEGHVAELATAFQRHRLSVAPLRYGAGFKGKLATSLAHGVPAVCTPAAVEGSGLTQCEGVRVADDPETFAQALAGFYRDRVQWQAASRAGRLHVQRHLSRAAGLKSLSRLLNP